ncbi:hypothetical protein CEUSTIGMA_g11292.t1 [Chlamydomonas eustigma]|uniref:Uncharacterized protein n=1 Tax=Chlamydomonas eustigma TaxID=1157962 RepID=A0A250XLB9_9CHLO|nr:hypothetical protein CEUSTIGMA_g11292.t1 [Chlamydomonas eustigma]|eukprot:GAX83867.1 hypothetical protein CEUSTIGMA_g11292.t1 [Chlamydomonas eustigma]
MRDVVRMRGDHAIAIILVLGLHSFARSALNIEEAGIKIVYPPGHRTQTIKWALADFGIEKYGGQLLGNVFYPTEDTSFYSANVKPPKCVPTDAQYGCTLFSKCTGFSLPRNDGNQIIMLLDRGPARTEDPCYFVKKVYYAQQAGADAVLVVNDVAGADLSTAIAPDEEVFAKMAEDITISAGLISKEDGDIIKDMLKSGNAVTLLLNWTSALPQKAKVSWELWSNSNDECGTLCDEQLAFVRDMKATAKKLQDSGLATFSPHYILFACPAQYLDTPECQSQCIMKGAFCAQDPDGSVAEGYAGLDVLKINMMQLCFFQVANTSGQPDLWWDYVDMFGRNCTMKDKQYTEECARRVFVSVGGPALSMNTGLTLWEQCIPNVTALAQNTTARVPLLEQEQALQRGSDSMNPVSIMPTVRINGVQYRGKHDAASVTRAICAAFPTGSEPALCNDRAVSDNECLVDAIGYRRCRVRTSRAVNSCNNTFSGSGYKCVCGKGYKRGTDDLSGGETCDDENECINHSYIPRPGGPTEKPACSCSRCACINTEGGFNCTGPLPNKCTA